MTHENSNVILVNENIKRNYECQLCGKKLSTDRNLQNHILYVHKEKGKYDCNKCEATFEQRLYLQNHVTNQHGENEFPCNICSKTFKNVREQRLLSSAGTLK